MTANTQNPYIEARLFRLEQLVYWMGAAMMALMACVLQLKGFDLLAYIPGALSFVVMTLAILRGWLN